MSNTFSNRDRYTNPPKKNLDPVGDLKGGEFKEYTYSKAGNCISRKFKKIYEWFRLINIFSFSTASVALPTASSLVSAPKASYNLAKELNYNVKKLKIDMGGRASVGYTLKKNSPSNNNYLYQSKV